MKKTTIEVLYVTKTKNNIKGELKDLLSLLEFDEESLEHISEELIRVRTMIDDKYSLLLSASELINFISQAMNYNEYNLLAFDSDEPLSFRMEMFLRDTPLDDIDRLYEVYRNTDENDLEGITKMIDEGITDGDAPLCKNPHIPINSKLSHVRSLIK